MFCHKFFDGIIPSMSLTEADYELIASVNKELHLYTDNLEHIRLRDGLRNVLSISRLGNGYIQANKPWELVKGSDTDRDHAGSVTGVAVNISWLLSVLLEPYMPKVSESIQKQLQAPANRSVIPPHLTPCLLPGHRIGMPSPLFKKIQPEHAAALKSRFGGKQRADSSTASAEEIAKLEAQVEAQGTKVRQMKTEKAEKTAVDAAVKELLSLKQSLARAKGESL
jgi:methionyl-tRNA synthetase